MYLDNRIFLAAIYAPFTRKARVYMAEQNIRRRDGKMISVGIINRAIQNPIYNWRFAKRRQQIRSLARLENH